MTTVFIGGSRHVSRLPANVVERLDNIVDKSHSVVVGDANGADKAVQRHLAKRDYAAVTVFCSGEKPRNNLADWPIRSVVPGAARGFHFYAAKDREMAKEADVGLMIWDARSPGTLLNVLRLVRADKVAVLANVPERSLQKVRAGEAWRSLFASLSDEVRESMRERATADEWAFAEPLPQHNFDLIQDDPDGPSIDPAMMVDRMNAALRVGNAPAFLDALAALTGESDPDIAALEHADFARILALMTGSGLSVRIAATRR